MNEPNNPRRNGSEPKDLSTTELEYLNRAHRALSAANQAVLRAESPQVLLEEVCRVVTEIAGYSLAWIGIPEQDEERSVRIAASAGGAKDYVDNLKVTWDADSPLGRGPVGTSIREAHTVVVRHVTEDTSFEPWRESAIKHGFQSVIGVPLFDEDQVWGSIAIYAREPDAFNNAEVSLIKQLGADLSFGRQLLLMRKQHMETLRQLADREEMLFSLVQTAPTLIFLATLDGTIELFNHACETLTGYTSDEVIGENIFELFAPHADRTNTCSFEYPAAESGQSGQCEYLWHTRHQGERLIEWQCRVVARPDGNQSILSIGIDSTERRQHEQQMRQLSSAIEAAAEMIMITDNEGEIEYVNPAFEDNFGYTAEEVIGKRPNILKSGLHDTAFYKKLWRTIQGGRPFRAVFMNRCKNGMLCYEDKTITPLKNPQGVITHYIATGRNVTKERHAEEQIHQLSSYDTLTNLPNRALFLDRLEQATQRPQGRNDEHAVLFIDLDRFKVINETLGHAAGDQLIRDISSRISNCVRGGDTLARLGGDKFAILMQDIDSVDSVSPCAQRILDVFDPPFLINDEELFVTASVGISLYPVDSKDASHLLSHAESAMQQAKDRGKNRYQFYTADINTRSFEKLSLETSLRKALERDELILHFQPQVDIHSGAIESVEALIRWNHPDLGLVSPGEFIPLLEETGLIVPVGEWVLDTAVRQHMAWVNEGLPPLEVAVNLSAIQLNQENLVQVVEKSLVDHGMDPRYLELEITESAVMQRLRDVVRLLREFKTMGIRLTVDDFGTGYSSLSYLTKLPIDTLKVDRSFVRNVPDNENDAEVTQAVVALSHALRLTVVAEGIETETQLRFLRSLGCHRAQGFYFSRPVIAAEISTLRNEPLPVQ